MWHIFLFDLNYYCFVSFIDRSKEMGGSYYMCINDPFQEDAKTSAPGMHASLFSSSFLVFYFVLSIPQNRLCVSIHSIQKTKTFFIILHMLSLLFRILH